MPHICLSRDRSAADGSAAHAVPDHSRASSVRLVTLCSWKNAGVVRSFVSSQAVAFAPSSQNSAGCGVPGFDQAQLTHMKPSGLFCRANSRRPSAGRCSRDRISASDRTDPQPPAGPLKGLIRGFRPLMAAIFISDLCLVRHKRIGGPLVQSLNWVIHSQIRAGLSSPSISTVASVVSWICPGRFSTISSDLNLPRTRLPDSTGDRNRSLLLP